MPYLTADTQAMPSTYNPSPLSYGSPRTSPFRRPESPASPRAASPSLGVRPTTPNISPTKQEQLRSPSPLKLQNSTSPQSDAQSWMPRGLDSALSSPQSSKDIAASKTPVTTGASRTPTRPAVTRMNNDAISKLPTPQVRELREGFQTLDRDNDGLVNREDVVDVLTSLGQPSSASDISPFFPPGAPQTMPLPTYLSTIATLLAPLSAQQELLNAFSAFDDYDSGEVDVGELRDALLNTAPDPGERALSDREISEVLSGFTGRRAFTKGGSKMGGGSGALGCGPNVKGDVFRYRDWVGGVVSAPEKVEAE